MYKMRSIRLGRGGGGGSRWGVRGGGELGHAKCIGKKNFNSPDNE